MLNDDLTFLLALNLSTDGFEMIILEQLIWKLGIWSAKSMSMAAGPDGT